MSAQRRLQILGGIVALAAVVVVVAILVSSGGSSSPPKPAPAGPAAGPPAGAAQVTALFRGIPQSGVTLGRPDAPVTLVEFADLKCPVCREFSAQALPSLVRDYVRTGKARLEVRLQTFIGRDTAPGDSERAARFALAAGQQNRLWQFADLFYVNQLDENTRYVTDAFLRRLGGAIPGLNVAEALRGASGPAVDNQLTRAVADFSSAGATGTPAFVLGPTGGKLRRLEVSSFAPSQFAAALDAQLKKGS